MKHTKNTSQNHNTTLVISLSDILGPTMDMRSTTSESHDSELRESIRDVGLINPILVKKTGKKYEVIAGARRWRAVRDLGHDDVRCSIYTGDELAAEIAKMHENQMREEVCSVSEAKFLRRLADAYNLNGKQLAAKIGRSESYVCERLALLKAPIELQDAVRTGALSFSAARELSRIKNEAVRETYSIHAINSGINDATAKQWRLDANAAEAQMQPAPEPSVTATQDNVVPIKVTCALTGKTVRIEETVLVRIDQKSWDIILAGALDV